MVLIPERGDPTLDAVNEAIEREQLPHASKNIGFGEIGHECSRFLWYKINSQEGERFTADTLRIFRNGHEDEAAMARDLRKVEGITLYTHDPERDNKQYKFENLDSRFQGRLDGVVVGLKQAPKTFHIWEHKSVGDKKFEALIKNPVLKDWNIVYYAQAQSAMLHAELERYYMTISTPGLRRVTSLRGELDREFAESLVDKARRIINATEPPERISNDPCWFQCRYCRFQGVCHGK